MLCPAIALAQNNIYGKITDQQQNPLEFVTVAALRLPDSTVLQTIMTDSAGLYQLHASGTSPVLIRAVLSGYLQSSKMVHPGNEPSVRADISLHADKKALKTVVVSAAKPLIERKTDRTIFNVANSTSTIGADALEVIRKAPGVRVKENQITLAGKSAVSVLLNDKLVQLSGDELAALLRSIPADNISRIEVITTPPAKYDAAGNSGLINIVTKKALQNGLNGNATLSYMQRISNAGGAYANLNYRHNKLNIFSYMNAYRADARPDMNITTKYTDQEWVQHSDISNRNVFNRVQLGADYNLSPNSIIGFLYTRANGGDQYSADAFITAKGYNLSGGIDSLTRTNAHTEDRGIRNVFNLNYEWKIDTSGRKLNVDLDYFSRNGKSNRSVNTGNFYENGIATGPANITRTSGDQQIDIRSAKADIAWPTRFAVFSFGGKISFIHNTSNNLFQYLQDTAYVKDPDKTNEFDYRENTQALYLSASKQLGKWSLQAGIRGEYTQTKGISATVQQTNTNDYLKFFPTAYVQYKVNDDHTLNFNYSKRIDRPSFWDMNPFRTYFTATSYSQGNPFLQPSFSNNLELSYVLKSKYTIAVYSQFVTSLSTRISVVDTQNKSYAFNFANVGKVTNYGGSFSATLNPFKWWESLLTGNAFYSIFKSDYYSGPQGNYSSPGFTVESNNTFKLNKAQTVTGELNMTYSSRQIDDFDVIRSVSNISAGIKWLVLQKRIILAANVFDMFRGEQIRLQNQYNGTVQHNYWDERTFRFAVTWKFGNKNVTDKRNREAGSDDAGRAK